MSEFETPSPSGRPGGVPSPDGNLAAQIERLVELHAAGHLTDEEFTQAKATLLAGVTRRTVPSPAPPPKAANIHGTRPSVEGASSTAPGPGAAPSDNQSRSPASPHLEPPTSWPDPSASEQRLPPMETSALPWVGPGGKRPWKTSEKWIASMLGIVLVALGVFVIHSFLDARKPHQKVYGTFLISNGSYDSSNEYETPNFTGGVDGCEGHAGYGDLNSSTQVVVKDNHGNEVTRTELGVGIDTSDEILGGCLFKFEFEVTKGPKYFVVSVGRRGETQYTYKELSEPGAIELAIGS